MVLVWLILDKSFFFFKDIHVSIFKIKESSKYFSKSSDIYMDILSLTLE